MIFLSETRLLLTDCWCSCVLPRTFFFGFFSLLVDRATVQHRPSPTGLTHLGLIVVGGAYRHTTAQTPPLLPCPLRPVRNTIPSRSPRPSGHFSYSCSPKTDAKKWCSYFYFSRSVSVRLGFSLKE